MPEVFWNTGEDDQFVDGLTSALADCGGMDVVSGYIGYDTATRFGRWIIDTARAGGRIRILIGMAGIEGLSSRTHKVWNDIDSHLRETGTGSGVFSFEKKIHAKVYIVYDWDLKPETTFVGSANFNFSNSNIECMVRLPPDRSTCGMVERLFGDQRLLPISLVPVKGSAKDPMTQTKIPIQRHNEIFDISEMRLVESINLRSICEKNPIGSLNLYHGRGRLNRAKMSWKPRPWYEVELTIGNNRYPGLPKVFSAYTDDGEIIQMHRSGGGPTGKPELGLKDLTGKGKGGRELFGQWIKGKLEKAGVLERGDQVTGSTLDAFGNDQLEFYRISDDELYMRFLP